MDQKQFWEYYKFDVSGSKTMDCRHWNCPKMVDWDPPPKIKNFPNFIIFDQKPLTTADENDQNLWFLKKNFVFEKFENWMGFDQNSLTITHETAKYDEKI